MIPRPVSLLLLPLALAACATPRESCIRDVQSELRAVTRDIAQTRANLDRGYRVVRTRETEFATTTCFARTRDGDTVGYPCSRPVTVTNATPIGIDYTEERARLARLQARQSSLVGPTRAAVSQCRARFPAES